MSNIGTDSGVSEGLVACLAPLTVPMLVGFSGLWTGVVGYPHFMPVEFLSDAEAEAYGRYAATVVQADLDRVFFLDDADLVLIGRRRGEHMRLRLGLQLATVRHLGAFLEDPLDVPSAVVDFVAAQVGVADPSCLKRYAEREKTRFKHQWEIRQAFGWKDFADVEEQFGEWIAARSWASGDGPKAIFHDGVS